jgi:hypothetical protein
MFSLIFVSASDLITCACTCQGADLSQQSPAVSESVAALRSELEAYKAEQAQQWQLPEQQASTLMKVWRCVCVHVCVRMCMCIFHMCVGSMYV